MRVARALFVSARVFVSGTRDYVTREACARRRRGDVFRGDARRDEHEDDDDDE